MVVPSAVILPQCLLPFCSYRLHLSRIQTFRHRLQDHFLARLLQQLYQPHHLPVLQPGVQESFPKFTLGSMSEKDPQAAPPSSECSSESKPGSQSATLSGTGQQGGALSAQPILLHGPVQNALLQGQQGVGCLPRGSRRWIGTSQDGEGQGGQTLQ